ncbi:tight adherence protein B [Tistlia consotensis]|uniref:Tight adherence protein B n=1 Tax=Tistlia consotensis USBA 355 TaxID=560819 RepID=A0A1Y6BJA3_9PROT|nr:type II secretion system F family protein [Tistlia consotensis]SMF12535.1 tight adherence protein B [Tistlia consotensis USBA 355]SNR51023.1 tight adherence protein B [Tistlia consotensis]
MAAAGTLDLQQLLPIVLAGGLGLCVLMVALALGGEGGVPGRTMKRRLARVGRGPLQPGPARRGGGVRRLEPEGAFPSLDRLMRTLLPRPQKLRQRLARTGRRISLGHYLAGCLAVFALDAGIAIELFRLPPLLALPEALAFGLWLPHLVVGSLGRRRTARFLALFPDAIDLIVRGLRSGLPVSESIRAVAHELAEPVGGEFRQVADGLRVGATLEDSLWATARRLEIPEFNFLVIAMAIQRETGGNLAETLANLSQLLRHRRQFKLKVKAISSEARASAWIIGSLPFVMFGILMLVNRSYVLQLFNDPRGMIMTGIGLTGVLVGVLVMARMVRLDA